ncbi:MAG: hypothetical protein JW798_08860 [Prolixibacteraceae bacterium]|nr:hypothetical protein [Prolixibacteraceae bacterium]
MRAYMAIYLFLFLAFFACKEENIEVNQPESIQAGNNSNLLVHSYDNLIIGGYNMEKSFELDLDYDNKADFRLTSEIWGSPGMGQHPEVQLLSLTPLCLLNGYKSSDTIFYNFKADTTNNNDQSKVYVKHTKTYSCEKLASGDSIVSIQPETFNLRYINSGGKIYKSDDYLAGKFSLSDITTGDIDGPYNWYDTVITFRSYYHFTCNSVPNDEIIYIGIKMKDSIDEKLGWIKMAVMQQYEIALLETAIQQ